MLGTAAFTLSAQQMPGTEIDVSVTGLVSSGTFAPHLMSSLSQGKIVQGRTALFDAGIYHRSPVKKHLSWGVGAEIIAGAANEATYQRWYEETHEWLPNRQRPASFWIQQLYAEAKYHGIALSAGMKERGSAMLDNSLSSGDFVYSGNCRPIPQVMIGLDGFQDIPYTRGWMQIDAALSYGAMTDSRWVRHHFNYYNYHIAAGQLYTYKRIHFRTNPGQLLSAEFGAQMGAFFGGKAVYYDKGHIYRTYEYKKDLGSFINMIFPVFTEAETFVQGQNLGSWDFKGRLRIDSGHEIAAYFEWPFEDGSGVARRNGWDGIWGLEYRSSQGGLVTAAVVEYIDFRNQSGPLHYAPGDYNSPTLTTNLTGRDNYYNNGFYNSYANYGMAIGTPFMLSPVYNLDGYTGFACNRMNGFHAGVRGSITPALSYRALFGYRRGMGTYDKPYSEPLTCTSAMIQARYNLSNGFSFAGKLAFDAGKLQGNNFGAMFTISYSHLSR